MNWETLLCLGDSITIGARSYAGYPEYTAHYLSLALEKDWNVLNCAVSGYTAIDICRHFDLQLSNLSALKPDFATVLIGTNDVKKGTSEENYRLALRLLLLKCKLLLGNQNFVVLSIPELAAGIKYPYTLRMNTGIGAFNRIIEEETAATGVRNLRLRLEPDDFFDGVHLNEAGCKSVGKQITQIILEDKGLIVNEKEYGNFTRNNQIRAVVTKAS